MNTVIENEVFSLGMIAQNNKTNNTTISDVLLCVKMNKIGIGFDTENTLCRWYKDRGLMTARESKGNI